MQSPPWQEISNSYFSEDGDMFQESRAVVCDINKEMLKVGKQKADSSRISAGQFHCHNIILLLHTHTYVYIYVYTYSAYMCIYV